MDVERYAALALTGLCLQGEGELVASNRVSEWL